MGDCLRCEEIFSAFSVLRDRHIRPWHTLARVMLSTLFQMQKEASENASDSLEHINSRTEGRNRLFCLCSQHSMSCEVREEEPQSVTKARGSTTLKEKKLKTQPCGIQVTVYSVVFQTSYCNLSAKPIMGGVANATWINPSWIKTFLTTYITLHSQ